MFDDFNDHSHLFGSACDCDPMVNVDGTPMIEGTGIDIDGHPYGCTDAFASDPFSGCADALHSDDWLFGTGSWSGGSAFDL